MLCEIELALARSRRRAAGLFLGVLHRNTILDTDVELGVDTAIQFSRLLRCNFGDMLVGQNCFRYSESKCDNTCGFQDLPPAHVVRKGLISKYQKYNFVLYL